MNRVRLSALAAALLLAISNSPSAISADGSPEDQLRRVMAKLKQLNPKFDGKETHVIEDGQVVELKFSSSKVKDLSPLQELSGLKRLSCRGSSESRLLADLSPLRGLQLTALFCSLTEIKDLGPLAGMPIETLDCGGTPVTDLSPLKNVPLKWLCLWGSSVSNLSPLSNSQFRWLNIKSTHVEDLSPLRNVPLEELHCDIRDDRDRQVIMSMTTLRRLNGADVQTALRSTGSAASKTTRTDTSRAPQMADPSAQKDAKKFAKNQSSIKGLYIQVTSMGQRMGSAQDIIATVERGNSNMETFCDVFGDIGKDTRISMEEAERLMKVRYPVWEAGRKIRFSYGDKYAKHIGGSSGGAFSVLLLSLLDGFQIDPGFSMTGDVTVDGKIRQVGAVAEKIRGARLEKCTVVAIPTANKDSLNDLAILYTPAMLWSIQILSVGTLDDAAATARLDKTPNLSKALTMFYQVQKGLGPYAPVAYLRNQDTYTTLQQVLQLAPNHLSAEFMLRAANNQLPTTLSLHGSVEEIWAASALMTSALTDKKAPDPKKDTRYYVRQLPAEAIKVALERLSWLDSRLHPKTRDLKNAMADYIQSLDYLRRQAGASSSAYSSNLAKRDRVLGELVKLGTDRNALEEMMH